MSRMASIFLIILSIVMLVSCEADQSLLGCSDSTAEPTPSPSPIPTKSPTKEPTTKRPTKSPTKEPTTRRPTKEPTLSPVTVSPTSTTTIECESHDDCFEFCYNGQCDSCSECHYCHDGIDGTCGYCGDGYPTMEGGPCESESEDSPDTSEPEDTTTTTKATTDTSTSVIGCIDGFDCDDGMSAMKADKIAHEEDELNTHDHTDNKDGGNGIVIGIVSAAVVFVLALSFGALFCYRRCQGKAKGIEIEEENVEPESAKDASGTSTGQTEIVEMEVADDMI